ncbi:MAG: hypothetical protein HZC48_13850 [Nitrospirae bacterium]|nr:hypothetical protein [Nitrospirota bacterium]
MAFLGRPNLGLGTPSRTAPTELGTVTISYRIPLFIDLLEKCFIKNCDDSVNAPIFQLNAEIWSTDRGENILTALPCTRDRSLFEILFQGNRFYRVRGDEILNASPVSGNPYAFQIIVEGSMTVNENQLNEDWGPFPPPGKPPTRKTRDEVFLRVYLASLFSAWQTIHTVDSHVETGQFFGP